MRHDTLRPHRALSQPLWWAALAVLVLNDHVLKGAGVVDGAITGKLSDVAGLMVAPAVLATMMAIGSRRGLAWIHGLIGGVFAAINLSPAAAAGWETLTAWTPFPWAVTLDPTDCLALPALLLSWRLFTPAMCRAADAGRIRGGLRLAGLAVGALACVATSPPECEESDDCPFSQPPPPQRFFPTHFESFHIGNPTEDLQVVRVRAVRSDLSFDCQTVLDDPTWSLTRAHFDTPEIWQLEPDRTIPISTWSQWERYPAGCRFYLIDGSHLEMTLVAWSTDEFPPVELPSLLSDAMDAEALGFVGGRLLLPAEGGSLEDHAIRFSAPPANPVPAAPGCGTVGEAHALAWDADVPLGSHVIDSWTEAPDGCLAIDLSAKRWHVCLPSGTFPFQAGDTVYIGSEDSGHNVQPIDGFEMISDTVTLRVGRGEDLVPLPEGDFTYSPSDDCAPAHDACGNLVSPLNFISETDLGPGVIDPATWEGSDADTLLLITRSAFVHIGVGGCSAGPEATQGPWIESLYIHTSPTDPTE